MCSIAIGLAVLFLTRSHLAVSTPVWVARRVQCRNNLKHIGLALHNYSETYDGFPATAGGDPPMSWRVAILPYVDQGPLFKAYDPARRWDEAPNTDVLTTRVYPMLCPAVERQHDEAGRYFASYVAPIGPETVLRRTESLQFAEITDGTSSTLMVVEACGLEIPWTEPRDFDVTRGPIGIDLKGHGRTDSPGLMSGYHTGGVHVLFGDGAVRFLSQKTDPAVLNALLTADGGDDPGEDW
ncbi:DUF1559 domain-containing protein [Planctellipticum variicoloris]|uniref:DUF1559 domain-containing protein n=1 Tax=Planctellipticum variicoloris TaxID=3064265 RepID=UPI003013E98B|nr:DUF1559 domain-containing protein [Planctomycetaceae bacterium SH412]